MKIEDYLELLRSTPLPSILVIGGIAFLLLSVLQRAGTSIETKPGRERFAILTGIVLLLSGVGLYLVPPTPLPGTPTAISTRQGEQQTTAPIQEATSITQTGSSTGAQIEDLGLSDNRPPMPEPAADGQVIVAHGDIDDSGSCHIKEFGPGEPIQGLGNGTFRLVRIKGTPEQIAAAEVRIQQAAASDAGGSCPWIGPSIQAGNPGELATATNRPIVLPTTADSYDCTTTVSASRPLVTHDSGEACWLQLVDGMASELIFNDEAQITYRTTSSGDDIYFYISNVGDRLTDVVGATIRPSRFVFFGYGSYENVRQFEIEYHSPGGGWVACLRDANNDYQPLNSVCK